MQPFPHCRRPRAPVVPAIALLRLTALSDLAPRSVPCAYVRPALLAPALSALPLSLALLALDFRSC